MSHINKTTKPLRAFKSNLVGYFPHPISHRVMFLRELTNGLPQAFLSFDSKATLSYRCPAFSEQLSKRTAKN